MRRSLLVILALLTGMMILQAKPVDESKAQRLGLNFIQHKALFARNAVNQMDLAYTFRAENGTATAYVFNFKGGFVIVAADDSYQPILGYSDCGNFDYDHAPDGLLFMLGELSDEIARCITERVKATSDIVCQWNNLESYGILHLEKSIPVVDALVQQRWNQDYPYNMYAPQGCPTGCVATAMAQLMKYWEWPTQGTGEHSYQWNGQTLCANFGETTYDWANMVDNYAFGTHTQEEKEAVATLMIHCGVSVNMQFAPDGSGAYSWEVPDAIHDYFSYSEHATHISKTGSYDEWIALLKTNIDQRIPIYYSGQSTEGGHAFVCDGYDSDDLFHFNWGWGGSSNGYFLIDGSHFDYSGSQAIVYDFIPNYIYDEMPQTVENLAVTIDSDVSRVGHLTWTNPTTTMSGAPLTSLDRVIVKRNDIVVQEFTSVTPGQTMTCDDEVPYFDQFKYTVYVVAGNNYGRTAITKAVFGPYCTWKVMMTSTSMQGWDGGGITVQNAAGSYIDFLTTNTSSASMQNFQMALGNNNLYWVEPNSAITNISFKIKDSDNQLVYEYNGPSSGLEAGLIKTLNNSCGQENTCESPYNLKAMLDPENDQTVILTWDSDHDPEFGYCIYRDGILFNMAHEKQYVDEHTNLGGHCYYITALCNGGETEKSNDFCITSGTGCDEPSGLYYKFDNNKVHLYWTAPENIEPTGYVIYRRTETTSFKEIKRIRDTHYKDASSIQGVVYQYAVVSYYQETDCYSTYANDLLDDGKYLIEVDWSNIPKDLKAELVNAGGTSNVSLHWRPAFHATSYDVIRNGVKIAEVTDNEFVDEGVEVGEVLCYQVVAYGEGFEESSNESCVLPCLAPTSLEGDLILIGEGVYKIKVTWQAPEGRVPEHYNLTRIDEIAQDTVVMAVVDNVYEEDYQMGLIDRMYQVTAVYFDGESGFALTANGENHVRLNNLAVDEYQMNVRLYPNPTTGQLSITAEGMTSLSVYDLVGQCLMQMTTEDGNATFDLSSLQNGIYLVKVSTVNGSTIQRVIKM